MLKKFILMFISSVLLMSCTSCATLPWNAEFEYPTSSFVKMEIFINDALASSGSGSVVAQTDKGALILTAFHVCASSQMEIRAAMGGHGLIIKAHGHEAEVMTGDYDLDVCLMLVPEGLEEAPPLSIATQRPEKSENFYTVSSPLGIADIENNLVAVFKGKFLGVTELGGRDRAVYSISSAGGSSGAPIMNEDSEVVSITTHGSPRFSAITIGPKWEEFYAFISEAMELED